MCMCVCTIYVLVRNWVVFNYENQCEFANLLKRTQIETFEVFFFFFIQNIAQ